MPTTAATHSGITTAKELMGAWAIDRFDDPTNEPSLLSLERLPVPKVEPRDVLVQMHGAEVGNWDAILARGEWPVERPFPVVLGVGGAGTVAAVGTDVADFAKGDRVYTFSHPHSHPGCPSRDHNGAWAEFMLVPFDRVAHAPASLDLVHAGACPLRALTAHESVVSILRVEKDDVLLVTAAAGGVGQLAIQLAARRGAHVVAIARARHHDYLRAFGAETVIDYTREDLVEATVDRYPGGVDKALNGVVGETASKVLQAVRPGGDILDLTLSQTAPVPDRHVISDYIVRPDRERLETIAEMFDRGELTLDVSHSVPFTRAPDALTEVLQMKGHGIIALAIQ